MWYIYIYSYTHPGSPDAEAAADPQWDQQKGELIKLIMKKQMK